MADRKEETRLKNKMTNLVGTVPGSTEPRLSGFPEDSSVANVLTLFMQIGWNLCFLFCTLKHKHTAKHFKHSNIIKEQILAQKKRKMKRNMFLGSNLHCTWQRHPPNTLHKHTHTHTVSVQGH